MITRSWFSTVADAEVDAAFHVAPSSEEVSDKSSADDFDESKESWVAFFFTVLTLVFLLHDVVERQELGLSSTHNKLNIMAYGLVLTLML